MLKGIINLLNSWREFIVTGRAALFTPESSAAWQAEAEKAMARFARPKGEFERDGEKPLQISEQFMIVLTAGMKKHQVELLERFEGEGLECKALVG